MRLSRPRSRPTTTQKNLAVPGIEPGTSVSVARNSDHRGGPVHHYQNHNHHSHHHHHHLFLVLILLQFLQRKIFYSAHACAFTFHVIGYSGKLCSSVSPVPHCYKALSDTSLQQTINMSC